MALKLLVVDDDPGVMRFIKGEVGALGYQVLGLADSRKAAEHVNRQKFDGAIVDAQMPHMDGLALTRHIRSSRSNSKLPIVMVTEHDDLQIMGEAFKAGVTFLMNKPITQERLRKLLCAARGSILREERRYVRLPLHTTVKCKASQAHFDAGSLNISEGGMRLDYSGGIQVGQELLVHFTLPSHPIPLNPHVKVVHREASDHIAVEFLELTAEDRAAIQAFIIDRIKG